MNTPVQITFRGLAHSEALESTIRQRAQNLAAVCNRITSCRVLVELPDRHKVHGRQYVVRLDIRLPGAEIAVNHERAEDPHVAVREAFDAARGQLAAHKHHSEDLRRSG